MVVVRSIDNAGHTMRALTITSKLRQQGSALAAALARPDVQSALTDVSWRTGAAHVTGVSVVCGEPEPELISVRETATGAVTEAEVVWQGSDGALDQGLDEFMPEGPQRTRLDWKNLAKYAPDVDDPRKTPMPADRATLRRPGRVSSRRGYLPPPLPVDTVARIFELRDEGLSLKRGSSFRRPRRRSRSNTPAPTDVPQIPLPQRRTLLLQQSRQRALHEAAPASTGTAGVELPPARGHGPATPRLE